MLGKLMNKKDVLLVTGSLIFGAVVSLISVNSYWLGQLELIRATPNPTVTVTATPKPFVSKPVARNLMDFLRVKPSAWVRDYDIPKEWGADEFYYSTADLSGNCDLLVYNEGTPRPDVYPANHEPVTQWAGAWGKKYVVLESGGVWESPTYYIASGKDAPCTREALSIFGWKIDERGHLID